MITDRAHDEAGKLLMGHPPGVPHKNLKARRLECWLTADESEPQQVGIKRRNVT